MQPHEAPVGGFVQGLMLQQLLRHLNGGAVIAAIFVQEHQAFCCLHKPGTQRLAQGDDPVVIASGQQVSLVLAAGRLQRIDCLIARQGSGARHRTLKLGHVACERRVWEPLHDFGIGLQETAKLRKGMAQVEQLLTQIGERLGFSGVRPESECDMLA